MGLQRDDVGESNREDRTNCRVWKEIVHFLNSFSQERYPDRLIYGQSIQHQRLSVSLDSTTVSIQVDFTQPCGSSATGAIMDSPGNFCMYDSEYLAEKDLNKPDEVFLFGNEDDSMNFGGLADYTGFFQNENSIDLNAYINPSTSPSSDLIQLSDLLPSSPPKSTIPSGLPPLIRPEEIDTTSCTPSNSRHSIQNTTSPTVTVANLQDSMPSTHPEFMPQHQDCQEASAALQVKAEPQEHVEQASEFSYEGDYDDDASTYTSGPSRPASPVLASPPQRGRKVTFKSSSSRRVRPVPDKDSDEYKQKRYKNNIAVRRSREKSKAKSVALQGKVKELTDENQRLNKRVELLTKELTVLKSLFTNVGKPAPPSLDNV